eukprot:544149-Alexandrium_andersonii.AAC.1
MALKPQSPSPPRSSTRSTCPLKFTSVGSARSFFKAESVAAASAEDLAAAPAAWPGGLGLGR